MKTLLPYGIQNVRDIVLDNFIARVAVLHINVSKHIVTSIWRDFQEQKRTSQGAMRDRLH